MNAPLSPGKGWPRLLALTAIGLALCGGYLVGGGEAISAFLVWLDFLAGMPGLSGLALLAIAILCLMILGLAAQWVVEGFQDDRRQTSIRPLN